MLLSYSQLWRHVRLGVIDAPFENINSTSIDLTLGPIILKENYVPRTVELWDKKAPVMNQYRCDGEEGYVIKPNEFILASTQEEFNFPDHISGVFKLKSSMARAGLEHLNAGWIDAGFFGSVLTLEFKNMNQFHSLRIKAGMKIGQVILYEHVPVPSEHSYRNKGRYNNSKTTTESKGVV